jgi:hypothetical protein
MPLPVRIPCDHCKGDRMFVWCSETRKWKCNDCGTVKSEVRTTQYDVFMRRNRIRRLRKESVADG